MRAGDYAVFEGVTYRARLESKRVHLIVSTAEPRPDGWEGHSTDEYWLKTIPRSSASRLFSVQTMALLDGVPVGVVSLHEATGTAQVWALAPYQGPEPALHPDLTWMADNASQEWVGNVAIEKLTDVDEPEYEVEVESRHVPQPVWYPRRPA
jgi:hypothetical protein